MEGILFLLGSFSYIQAYLRFDYTHCFVAVLCVYLWLWLGSHVFDVGIWNYEALSHSNLVNVILLILIDRLGLGFRIISAIMNLLFPIWRGNLLECHFWELIDL